MSNAKKHKEREGVRQSQPPQQPLSSHRPKIPLRRRLLRRGLAALGTIATIVTLILAADWAIDQFGLLSPEINPDPVQTAAESSPFLLFSIRNNSKFADFYHIEVGCNFHVQVFGNEKYKLIMEGRAIDPGFDPKERDVILYRGKSITFPCDPAMEPVSPTFNNEVLRNLSAELYLSVRYSVHVIFFDWFRRSRSPTYHCVNPGSGLRCTTAESVHPDLPITPPRK